MALSACMAGPEYRSPPATLAPFHNAAAVQARNPCPAPPLEAWWTGFGDPDLQAIVRRALAQDLDLAAALARVQQARAAAQEASAQLLPTVDATSQASALRQSLNSPIGEIGRHLPGYRRDERAYDVGAAASWEIDLAGGLRRGEQAAEAEAQAAQAQLDGVRVSVAADAADAYLQIRGDQARLAETAQQVEVDTHLLALLRQLQARGVANDREVAQAEAVLAQAQAALPPLRIDLEAQFNRLDVLLGAQPGTSGAGLAKPAGIPAPPAIPPAATPTEFLRRRPDIIAAERQLAAASARIGVAVAAYYPKLSLSGLLGFDSLSANRLFTPASFEPVGTGALRWRIFDFGQVDAAVAQARGAHAEALARYRQTVLRAAEDVEDAFRALTETGIRTARLQEQVRALQRSRDLSQQAFAAGAIPLTDVLDADRLLLVARDDLARNRADTARAAVRSYRAMGGGWSG